MGISGLSCVPPLPSTLTAGTSASSESSQVSSACLSLCPEVIDSCVFHPLGMFDPTHRVSPSTAEVKYSLASSCLGSPQVITWISKAGQAVQVWWPWGTCHVGHVVSFREGISKSRHSQYRSRRGRHILQGNDLPEGEEQDGSISSCGLVDTFVFNWSPSFFFKLMVAELRSFQL